jgi:5-methylcytosine-specific restriction endonuclease McrA
MLCGYDKNPNAMDFHHRNPKEKDIGISRLVMSKWERVKHELNKCDLLCSNCHRELHYPFKL